jgi:chemotaxis protein MotA
MDYRIFGGVLLGLLALLGSAYLEGMSLGILLSGPTALLVIGGTMAACLVHSPPGLWRPVLRATGHAFLRSPDRLDRRRDFVRWAGLARRDGVLALEGVAEKESDELLQLGLKNLVDSASDGGLRELLTDVVERRLRPTEQAAELFEAAGGYAPTMGVLGAVLGLIGALQQLEDPSAIGAGVASAFVATFYGLALANLVLLPLSGRLRALAEHQRIVEGEFLESILAIGRLEHPQKLAERFGIAVEKSKK